MIKAIIIDDESAARGTIDTIVKKYCSDVELIGEADSVASGIKLIGTAKPDLVFLDIQMGDGTGFDLLQQLTERDFLVIFVTAFDEFALKAFKFNAVNYLLKPADPLELIEAINNIKSIQKQAIKQQVDELLNVMKTKEVKRIVLSSTNNSFVIEISSIIRVEADGAYSHFILKDGRKITVSKTMKEYETMLPKSDFFRVHQSHLININEVKSVNISDNYAEMSNEDQVDISRRSKDAFVKFLKQTNS